MKKCKICGGKGYHKMSCPTQKVVIHIDNPKMYSKEEMRIMCKKAIISNCNLLSDSAMESALNNFDYWFKQQ